VLPASTRLGPAALTVTDLVRSIAFYEGAIGLRRRAGEAGRATLGTPARPLLELVEEPGARPAGRHAGLFHFALLHDSRRELARALRRVADAGVPLTGASDHGVSEALYLSDPDGNGIELYADRPRERWPAPGPGARVGMFTAPLDLGDLAAQAGEEPPPHAGEGLVMGHMHLHVGDLDAATGFYRDVVGLEEMVRLGDSANFLAAAGYHHHLGVNTWQGAGVPPMPPDAVGLRHWTIETGDPAAVSALSDRAAAQGAEPEALDGDVALAEPAGTKLLVRAR